MRASGPAAPKAPPAPIESLGSADKELKALTGKNFASGGGAGARQGGFAAKFGPNAGKQDRVDQLMSFITEQMSGLDKSRRSSGSGKAANTFAGASKRKSSDLGAQADPNNASQVLL